MFLHAARRQPEGDAENTGRTLVKECLDQIECADNPDRFPPKLFLLLVAPVWLKGGRAARLYGGICQELATRGYSDTAFIGSSVAGVIFDGKMHPEGIVLVCLASQFLTATVAAVDDLHDPRKAMDDLATKLGIQAKNANPNPDGNRSLLVFFPGPIPGGEGEFSAELHRYLLEASKHRLAFFGGGSSANTADEPLDWSVKAVQFDSRGLHTDSVTAALIESDFPVAGSLARGLRATSNEVKIESLASNKQIQDLADGETFASLATEHHGLVLFGRPGAREDRVVAVSIDGEPGRLFYPAHPGEKFIILSADAEEILHNSEKLLETARLRHRVEKPNGCLTFCCSGLYRNRKKIGFELGKDIEQLQRAAGTIIVGCLVDGEAGVEESGTSDFTHWSSVRILFGDELKVRSATRIGHGALAKRVRELASAKNLKNTIDTALSIISDAGFEGAMISLIIGRGDETPWVVAMPTQSIRFKKIVDETKRLLDGNDVIAQVATSNRPQLILDSLNDPRCDKQTAQKSGIISQFVLPLQDQDGVPIGVLQVDLGDLRQARETRKPVEEVLTSIASAVAASIARVTALEDARVVRALDEAFFAALTCDSVKDGLQIYIKAAVKAFQVDGGHLREWRQQEGKLVVIAGDGEYYEAILKHREKIDTSERSSIADSFLGKKTIVDNDAQANPSTIGMLKRTEVPSELKQEIRKIGSFANVFCAHRRQIGVITLHSKSPWFFHSYRERCLPVLRERAELLAGYLRAKERRIESKIKLDILLELQKVLKLFDESKTLDIGLGILAKGLRNTFGADMASVFLWEKELEQFVLRGEFGWSEPGWEGAARYKENVGWTGRKALESEPSLSESVNDYRVGTERDEFGTYKRQCWGNLAKPGFNVRGLSFPLNYRDERLGVITVLVGNGSVSEIPKRFTSESNDVLAEVANDVSAHIGALVFRARAVLSAKWRSGRDEILREFVRASHIGDPAGTLCRLIVEKFGAREAVFYAGPNIAQTECRAAWPESASREADELKGVRGTLRMMLDADSHAVINRDYQVERENVKDDEEPTSLARRGAIRRARFADGKSEALALLSITWPEGTRIQESEVNNDAIEEIRSLMRMVGPAYYRYLDDSNQKRERDNDKANTDALHTMSLVVVQSGHVFGSLLVDMEAIRDLVKNGQVETALDQIATVLNNGTTLVQRPLEVAMLTAKPNPRVCPLEEILINAMTNCSIEDQKAIMMNRHSVTNAWIEPGLTELAFRNLISNALNAIRDKEDGTLNIITRVSHEEGVAIVDFNDTGKGMSQKRLEEIKKSFVRSEKGWGAGFLLAQAAIKLQKGTLHIESAERVGTQIRIRLPIQSEVR